MTIPAGSNGMLGRVARMASCGGQLRLWISAATQQRGISHPDLGLERGGARMEFAPGDQTPALALERAKIIVGRPLLTAAEIWSSRPGCADLVAGYRQVMGDAVDLSLFG